jgi:glutamine synthetase
MRSGNPRMNGLLAAAALMMAASGAAAAMPQPEAAHREGYRPTPPRRDTALQREIAEHNAAVEARKAEKRARKRGA